MIAPKLNGDEFVEFMQARDYLASNHRLPEGSVAKVLNNLSPNVRKMFGAINEALETPRLEPFKAKLSEREIAEQLGFDADDVERIKASLDAEQVTAGLQSRLGTDRDLPAEEPSRRDTVEAALDYHALAGDNHANA